MSSSTTEESWKGRESLNNFYRDGWILIYQRLDEVSIISLSLTCKEAYRHARDYFVKQILCRPFKPRYKLTVEQFRCLYEMNASSVMKKRVVADVGAGKTLIALGYVFRKYLLGIGGPILLTVPGPDELQIAFDPQPPKIIICAPPSNVSQWSDAIEKFTNEKYISTYSGAKNYHHDWKDIFRSPEHRIFLTSMYTLSNLTGQMYRAGIRHVIIGDECHHVFFSGFKHLSVEVIGLTASASKDERTDWNQTFHMESSLLRDQLKPLEYVRYGYTGLTEYQRTAIKQSFHNVKKKITKSEQKRVMTQSLYGELLEHQGSFKVEKKRFIYRRMSEELKTEKFLEILFRIPKVIALVELAWNIKRKGEKLIIFDTSETGLGLLHLALRHNNVQSYAFTTDYNPKERSNLIKKFQENGDVLLGSIGMLSEGHCISAANHFLFVGNPENDEQFKQAAGRLRRYPQEKQVYLHILASCAIEEYFILSRISGDYKNIDKGEVFELLTEFMD